MLFRLANSAFIIDLSKTEEVSESLKQVTRRFAKRQLTWFRNRMQVTFYQIGEPDVQDRILSQIEEFLDD